MNNTSTYRKHALRFISAFVLFLALGTPVSAQTDIALPANGGYFYNGSGGANTASGVYNAYGAYQYNNDTVVAFPNVSGVNYTYVGSSAPNNYILFYKTNLPSTFSVNKIVFYYDYRPMQSCTIQYWNGSSYVTAMNYVNNGDFITNKGAHNYVVDSIMLPQTITTDTLKISNISGTIIYTNPTFREIRMYNLSSCSGTPSVSITGPASLSPCYGSVVFLHSTQSPTLTWGHNFQWQYATIGSSTWTSIAGANSPGYSFEANASLQYRVIDTCLSSGQTAISNTVQVNVTQPTYQSVPYYQGFDAAWTTGCSASPYSADIPAAGWTNTYPYGDSSWRRNDQSGTTTTTNTALWPSVTTGQYSPTNISGGYSARLHTSKFMTNIPANLDLHLDCSGQTGNKQLYFYMINTLSATPLSGGDSLRVLMSQDLGNTWTQLGSYDSAGAWRRRSLPIASNNAQTIIRFQGIRINTDGGGTDIGLDSVYVAAPCSGNPVAGHITPGGTVNACAGNSYNLTTIGTSMAGNLVYTWQQSLNGGATWTNVTGGSGYNTLFFTTPPLYDTVYYRLQVQCGATGTAVFSDTMKFNITSPSAGYAPIPYSQNFDNTWLSSCTFNQNIPDNYWANTPGTGNSSWRRVDAASSASWTAATGGAWFPTLPQAFDGLYCARFHSYQVPTGTMGNLDLQLDCSATTGSKQVGFAYMNTSGNDSLKVLFSSDAGNTFSLLGSYTTTTTWTYYTLLMPSNSATTVLRFQASSEGGSTDIGLDTVTVIPPCTGAPNPGIISTANPCPGANFTLLLQGSSVAAGLTYQWQDSIPGVSAQFNNIAGATGLSYTTNILINHYYRVKVKCTNSGITTITPLRLVQLAQFYYCYCASGASVSSGADIGNVSIKRLPGQSLALNNGVAVPLINNGSSYNTYTDYRYYIPPTPNSVPITPLYHDSTYVIMVTQINSGAFTPSTVSVWIDTNRNGVFDPGEKYMQAYTSNTSNPSQQVVDTFVMKDSAFVGITGMRVVLEQGYNSTPAPCGFASGGGETEDYLVEIRYPPCDGPPNAGTAIISDTSSCVGYTISVVDTSHEHKRYGIDWRWQYSPDGNSWADILSSIGHDTIVQTITGQSYYRLRIICNHNNLAFDTTYSNVVSVSINPSYSCYCFSLADGGNLDSSDIGAFQLGNLVVNTGGPHLLNAFAYRDRTDYTKLGVLDLWVDSTYPIKVYHIMRSATHADAKVTLFMDFNNDLQYNVTPSYTELVWTGYTTATNFLLADSITIPPYAIPGVKTGMRVILNNNTAPNIPSDEACGTYTSGETEDYVVQFHDASQGVNNISNITQLMLYPNPTEGRFTVDFVARKPVNNVAVIVTSITGQKISEQHYSNVGKDFSKGIDLTGMSRGVYLVELKVDDERLVRRVIIK